MAANNIPDAGTTFLLALFIEYDVSVQLMPDKSVNLWGPEIYHPVVRYSMAYMLQHQIKKVLTILEHTPSNKFPWSSSADRDLYLTDLDLKLNGRHSEWTPSNN